MTDLTQLTLKLEPPSCPNCKHFIATNYGTYINGVLFSNGNCAILKQRVHHFRPICESHKQD